MHRYLEKLIKRCLFLSFISVFKSVTYGLLIFQIGIFAIFSSLSFKDLEFSKNAFNLSLHSMVLCPRTEYVLKKEYKR